MEMLRTIFFPIFYVRFFLFLHDELDQSDFIFFLWLRAECANQQHLKEKNRNITVIVYFCFVL